MYIRYMKFLYSTGIVLIWSFLFIMEACNQPIVLQQTTHYLFHPQKEEINLEGSVMIMDGGIMVLLQNGPLKTVPTILIPTNDSAGQTLRSYYNEHLDLIYQPSNKPWVKVAGNFISEDSLSPVFKFSWVEFLDSATEIKEVEEMEE